MSSPRDQNYMAWLTDMWSRIQSALSGISTRVGTLESTSIPSKTSDLINDSGFLTQHQDISGKKNTQTAVGDPVASGTSVTFIDSISQDAQGVIMPTKKTVQSATTTQPGLMSADDKARLDNMELKSSAGPDDIVTIDDAAAIPVEDLTVAIEPVQSGSGDPSPENVRPITGWTGVNIVISPTQAAQDGITHSVSWQTEAGTVYGGTLDVTTGVLTVDKIGCVFNGNETWRTIGSDATRFHRYTYSGNTAVAGEQYRGSSHFKNERITTSTSVIGYYAYTGSESGDTIYVQFRPGIATITDTNKWKAWLSDQYAAGTPLTCWWTVSTPYTYQLTPIEVALFRGTNNIWADAGEVTVEYYRSDELGINEGFYAIKALKKKTATISSVTIGASGYENIENAMPSGMANFMFATVWSFGTVTGSGAGFDINASGDYIRGETNTTITDLVIAYFYTD